jgi:hypothetical protein
VPIPLPNLDDRTYADLFAEMRALIPRYAPAWTDHNDSDPGITLLQLFAWLAEATIYRLNRIPAASEAQFLKLLGASALDLDTARADAVRNLRARWRAITAEDFEAIALGEKRFGLARARCLPELNLEPGVADPQTARPGHVSLIIVPRGTEESPTPSQELIDQVWALLDERRLITCRHHVVGPGYTSVRVAVEVVHTSQVQKQTAIDEVTAGLRSFFDPLTGGPDKGGWPFGRHVYASEVYQVVERKASVDHVEALTLYAQQEAAGAWVAAANEVDVPANNLVDFVTQTDDVQAWGSR